MSAALLAVVAVLLTSSAGTRPSFDAYGWLTWGQMTLHGGLDTNAAPSFKPLPYVLTLVDALFGGAQMRLWMIESVAVSLAGLVFAGRLAYRLTGAGRDSASVATRAAGWLAAALAVVGVLCLHDEFPFGYLHYVLSAQSDPMVVALLLAAIDRQVGDRSGWAFALLGLAALGRPEVWPFLGLHGAWLWRRRPGCRWAVLAVPAGVALLWFGIPALTSRSWLIAADNAHASGFGPRHDKALGVLSRFVIQAPWPLQVAAVIAVIDGARRRDRLVGALAACVVVWMAIEVAFGLHGWPALGRYMFEASALVVVLGAGLVGRGLAVTVPVPASRWVRVGAIVACGAVGATIALAVTQGRAARSDLLRQRARTASIDRLTTLVGRLGGPTGVRACGEPISDGLATQTVLAFTVGRNVNAVGYRFPQPGHPHDPVVVFRPLVGGRWSARALRQGGGSGCRAR